MKQRQRPNMAVLSGALGGSKRQKGLRAVQGVVEHARLPGAEVVVLGLADQRRSGDLIGNLGEVVLADLVDQLLGCGAAKHPLRVRYPPPLRTRRLRTMGIKMSSAATDCSESRSSGWGPSIAAAMLSTPS